MIHLEVPRRFDALIEQAHQVAVHVLRPLSRTYDRDGHAYPHELDMLAATLDGLSASGELNGAGAGGGRRERPGDGNRNGSNVSTALGIAELCWGDVGLLLSLPRQGLGNAALAALADEQQLARFAGQWAAMAITEPDAGSDSAAIRTTATRDGDSYVLNGTKIFITAGQRADLLVVWASLDTSLGRAAIRSFVVPTGTPGCRFVRVEDKLGVRASDTAQYILEDCRVPTANFLGDPDIGTSFGGAMETFDNTRPLVAAMAVGLSRACLDRTRQLLADAGVELDVDRPAPTQPAAAADLLSMEADYEASRLLMLQAAWMGDNALPNTLEASFAKAKAGRSCVDIALRCVALAGSVGYGETELLEKWARDAKILDIFEGTQQIQLLIIARRLLGLSSSELK